MGAGTRQEVIAMITREDLRKLQSYNERLQSLERQKERLMDTVTNITQRLNGMPHGSDGHDRMMEFVAKLDELEEKFAVLIERQSELRLTIERALVDLPEQQERVIRLRFIDGLSWKRIARRMHYSESHLRKISLAALRRLGADSNDERF